jgi:nicotinamide mononucleotide transporter
MHLLESFAVLFGIACVVLTVRQNIWCWPTGLVQVVLYVYIFHEARLYSDMILHVIYVGLQIYGWYYWVRKGRQIGERLPVTRLAPSHMSAFATGTFAVAWVWGEVMARYTDAALPYLDAFIAVASLTAQFLMARKKLESWIVWIIVDVTAIYVFWSRDLMMTAGLYAVFLGLCIAGLTEWRKSFQARAASASVEATAA